MAIRRTPRCMATCRPWPKSAGRCRWCCRAAGDALRCRQLDRRRSTASSSPAAPRTWRRQRYGAPGRTGRCCSTASATPPSCRCCRRLIAAGVPVLGVCRGFQEIERRLRRHAGCRPCTNCPGGSITAKAITSARSNAGTTTATTLHIVPGGLLARLAGADAHAWSTRCTTRASSAWAAACASRPRRPTAWSKPSPSRTRTQFALAVQWHPEMRIDDSPLARAIFAAFGDACRRASAAAPVRAISLTA